MKSAFIVSSVHQGIIYPPPGGGCSPSQNFQYTPTPERVLPLGGCEWSAQAQRCTCSVYMILKRTSSLLGSYIGPPPVQVAEFTATVYASQCTLLCTLQLYVSGPKYILMHVRRQTRLDRALCSHVPQWNIILTCCEPLSFQLTQNIWRICIWHALEMGMENTSIDDLSGQDSMLNLGVSAEKAAMFPIFSTVVRKLLILPDGTATVERSFSTMNRILSSQRCRLLPNHACQLMQLSTEGPKVPNVRDGSDNEQQVWNVLMEKAYAKWLEQPRRGLI